MDEFIRVATLHEIPPGSAKRVEAAGRKIAVANVGGAIYAVDDNCTHEDQSLAEGPLMGEILVCPRHGSRFHLPSGRVLSLPAVRPVATYPVKVEGDAILISLEGRPGQGMPHKR